MNLIFGDRDRKAAGGTAVAPQQAPDLALERAALQRLLALLDSPFQTRQRRFDPRFETLMHGLLFLDPARRAAQQEGLGPFRTTTDLHLDVVADPTPAGTLRNLLGPALEFGL